MCSFWLCTSYFLALHSIFHTHSFFLSDLYITMDDSQLYPNGSDGVKALDDVSEDFSPGKSPRCLPFTIQVCWCHTHFLVLLKTTCRYFRPNFTTTPAIWLKSYHKWVECRISNCYNYALVLILLQRYSYTYRYWWRACVLG